MKKSTNRLNLSLFTLADAPFILQVLNEPGFKDNIGDRQVRSLEDARNYLQNNILPGYAQHGFSMFRVALKKTDEVIGMCGLLKRDHLEFADLGYAITQKYYGQGFATEAIQATLNIAQVDFSMTEIAAIISPHNEKSIHIVQKLGFEFLRMDTVKPNNEVKVFLKKF